MQKLVWCHRVVSKNFVSDFGASLKNIIGGRIKTYEKMVQDALTDANKEFQAKHPDARNVSLFMEQLGNQVLIVVVYGVIDAAD